MRLASLFPVFAIASVSLAAASLEVLQPRIEEYENGPKMPSDQVFSGGQSIFFSFHVGGGKATGEDEDHLHLTYTVEAFDSSAKPIATGKHGEIQTTLAPEDKKSKWTPKVRYDFRLPETPVPGTYTVKIHVQDENAEGSAADAEVQFRVAGLETDPSAGLAVYHFRFLRSESEADVVPAGGSFRPGDSVWAKFEMAGYKFGDKNRFDVSYGVTLKEAAGKVLYAKPDAARQTAESLYPTRFVPGAFGVELDRKTAPGTYVLVISAQDAIGNQTIESAHEFLVE